ncbi:scramblase [Corynebacterium sp. P3-F1]|uniref:scramblase n=1 Tax=Corynebacterium sp. P3-F1 TaxID=3059080 RepID=UPI00265D1934|nr:scramblase [Corynebacterium sp. P3-F1]WKK61418.1 scramblase [Corynebacterium sp. P3-F1]
MLREDMLTVSQSKTIGRDEFTIAGANGEVLGTARQTLKLSDLVKASRGVEVSDAAGNLALVIEDPVNFIRDTYTVRRVDDQTGTQMELAHITKRFSWIGAKFDVDITGFPPVKIEGQIFQLNYQITGEGRPIARVDAEYSGMGRALMGKTTYRLVFEPGLDENVHAAVIGIAIALDMRREKMRKSQ